VGQLQSVRRAGLADTKKQGPGLVQMDVERFCYELDDAIPDVKELVNSIFNSNQQVDN
jgi:hypothetical protein